MNPVRDLLKSGKTVVGTAGSLYEDNMAMLADSGLDFILFDSQHAQTSPSLPFHQCGNKLTVLRTGTEGDSTPSSRVRRATIAALEKAPIRRLLSRGNTYPFHNF